MDPDILRTCKQMYCEAKAILYSQNVFSITVLERMFRFMIQIHVRNIWLVKTLHIYVPYCAAFAPWLRVLDALAEEATGLRSLEIGWGENCEHPWQWKRGTPERGLGDNLGFARMLGKIQGLDMLVISGHYGKNWPAYLERTMSVRVRSVCGNFREEGYLTDEVLDDMEWLREHKLLRAGGLAAGASSYFLHMPFASNPWWPISSFLPNRSESYIYYVNAQPARNHFLLNSPSFHKQVKH